MQLHRSRLRKRLIAAFVLASVVSGSTAAALAPETTEDAEELRIAISLGIDELDPARVLGIGHALVYSAVYETLVKPDPDDFSNVLPQAAESWTVSDDATVYEFKLDPDARFSTGDEVSAEDVKFSWERLIGLAASPSYLAASIASIEAVDPLTVRVELVEPNGSFLSQITASAFVVYDAEAAMAAGATTSVETDQAQDFFNTQSIGSGPFRLDEFNRGENLTLAANEAFSGERPDFDAIRFLDIPETSTQRQLLERGDVDVALNLDFDTAQALESSNNVEILTDESVTVSILGLNNSTSEPLASREVRQAIQMAIDYDGIAAAFTAGTGTRPASIVALGLDDGSVEPAAQDQERARELLAAAGYPDGFDLTLAFESGTQSGIQQPVLAAKVQQDLEAIGISVSLEPMTYTALVGKFREGTLDSLIVSVAVAFPACANMVDYGGRPGGALSNRLGVTIPELDDVYSGLLATTSAVERAELCSQAVRLMQEDASVFTLVQPPQIYGLRPGVEGARFPGSVAIDLLNLTIGD